MAEHIIQSETLTAIADAIRAKKDTTAILTPAQMAVEIEGIVIGNDLPNAEETTFGTVEETEAITEYGITNYYYNSTNGSYSGSDNVQVGYSFDVVETFAVSGLRFYHSWSEWSGYACLWDSDGNLMAGISLKTTTAKAWVEVKFDNPINVISGNTYTVSINLNSAKKLENISYNPKITNVQAKAGTYGADSSSVTMPTTNIDNSYAYGIIDIIITDAVGMSTINEYKIKRDTVTTIADEVKRISGESGKLSTNQIISELQEVVTQTKTATPSTEEQTISPDEGYYALSSVTVGGATLQEKTVTPTTEEQTISPDEGYYGLSSVIVSAAESSGSGASGVQADYEQNDSTASDYIKNRPFYKEIGETIFDQDVTTVITDKALITYHHTDSVIDTSTLAVGDGYEISYNDDIYVYEIKGSERYFGNSALFIDQFAVNQGYANGSEFIEAVPSIADMYIDSGEPFVILVNDNGSMEFYTKEAGTYHFTITEVKYHKIDSNFIDMDDIDALPTVSSINDGQILGVVDGAWSATNAPSGLPEVTTDDEDKVLMVVDGAWIAGSIADGDEIAY